MKLIIAILALMAAIVFIYKVKIIINLQELKRIGKRFIEIAPAILLLFLFILLFIVIFKLIQVNVL